MVRLGESHAGRQLIRMFAPAAGRRDEVVHEQAGGPGHRRVCVRCGTAVEENEARCPVDGGVVVDVTVRVSNDGTATKSGPAHWDV